MFILLANIVDKHEENLQDEVFIFIASRHFDSKQKYAKFAVVNSVLQLLISQIHARDPFIDATPRCSFMHLVRGLAFKCRTLPNLLQVFDFNLLIVLCSSLEGAPGEGRCTFGTFSHFLINSPVLQFGIALFERFLHFEGSLRPISIHMLLISSFKSTIQLI